MKSYDASLLEVWSWKESVYEDFKNLTIKEYVEKIRKNTEEILQKEKIELTAVFLDKNNSKIA